MRNEEAGSNGSVTGLSLAGLGCADTEQIMRIDPEGEGGDGREDEQISGN